jgi:hypothetical protein
MPSRKQRYGSSVEEVWKQFASDIGGEFLSGASTWGGDKITARAGEWTVTLDTNTVASGYTSITCTRIRAPYLNRDGFHFRLFHRDVFSDIGGLLGMQDVRVADPHVDREFVIRSNDEDKVRRLLANPRIRALLVANPSVHMLVKQDEGWFGPSFPAGVDELYLEVVGVVRRAERLRALYELFAETLNHLCHLGSAYEDDPNLPL